MKKVIHRCFTRSSLWFLTQIKPGHALPPHFLIAKSFVRITLRRSYQSTRPIPETLCSVCNISFSCSGKLFGSPSTPRQEIRPCYLLASAYSGSLLLPFTPKSLHSRTGSEGSPCRDEKGPSYYLRDSCRDDKGTS